MNRANGVHHLAIATADIKKQIAFFSQILGMELVALYWMHGVEGALHGFLRMNDRSAVAFVQTPDIAEIDREIGKTHAGNPGLPCAGGTLQHLALRVDDEAELLALRDRVRSLGVNIFGPIDHGFCKSIYFAGPEDLSLEISTSADAIDAGAWIDPEVVTLCDISADELALYKAPKSFVAPSDPIQQPPIDQAQPHMYYPEKFYQNLVQMSDTDYEARFSETAPPVAV